MPRSRLSASKRSKKPQKRLDKLIPKKLQGSVLMISIGIFLFAVGGINYYRLRVLSFNNAPETTLKGDVLKGDVPTHITIPSLKIELPIEEGSIKNGVWEISYQNATFLSSSARPGQGGNTVIYGHNKKVIFGNLPYLKLGEKIFLKTADGQMRTYEVYKKDFVSPDRVDLVSPTNFEELTIYTCWGIFDNQRVVIKAKPA